MRATAFAALLFATLTTVSPATLAQQNTTPPSTPQAPAQAQAASHPLTIQEAEAIGLKNNPQITVGKLQALQSQEYVREVRSALLPTFSINLTGVGADGGSRLAAGYLTNGRMFSRVAGGITASQLITDFGRTPNLVSSSRYEAKAADENAVATKQQIILAVDQAFYNTLETKALLAVAEETVKARQILVDQVQALTNAKLKSDLDLSFAKVQMARAQLLQLDARNNYAASQSILSAVLGYPDRQDFVPVEPAMQVTPPAPDATPLIQQALDERPEVRGMRDEVVAAEKFERVHAPVGLDIGELTHEEIAVSIVAEAPWLVKLSGAMTALAVLLAINGFFLFVELPVG